MKQSRPLWPRLISSLRNRVNLFYLLAFAPLLLILYYNVWSLVMAFYGFIFLLMKSQKLRSFKEPKTLQRSLGFITVICSFFVYYLLVRIVPKAGFYGTTNYTVFLLGLFLVFFETSALKESFTPLFLIAATTASSSVAARLEPLFSPYLDDIAYLLVNILRTLGVNANLYFVYSVPIIRLTSLAGTTVGMSFVYECVGVFSTLVFSIILVIVLIEDPSSWKVKLLAAAVGVLGTFAINIVRVTIVLLTDYLYGAEAGANVHYIIGYALFSAWLAIFMFTYSKRQTLRIKIQSLLPRHNLMCT